MVFRRAYEKLKNKSDRKFSIQIYHHDNNGEPFYSSDSDVEKVILDFVGEHGLIITIITSEIMLSFSESNWLSHMGDDYVTFGSRKVDETYCIIEFC